MTDIDDLIAQLESTQFQHDAECELGFGSGLCKCYERLLHKAAAHLRAQKVETARLQKLEQQCWTSPEQWMAWCDIRMLERSEKAEAERDALRKDAKRHRIARDHARLGPHGEWVTILGDPHSVEKQKEHYDNDLDAAIEAGDLP